MKIVCLFQECSVLNLAQQTSRSDFTFQFSYMHIDPESRTLLTHDFMAGGRLGLKGGLCVVLAGGCMLSLINKFLT